MLTLDEVKEYLKIDYDDEDILLIALIKAAEAYLFNASGKKFDEENELAKLYQMILVNEWFKDRGLMISSSKKLNVNEKVRFTLQSIMLQLKCIGGEGNS